MGSFLPFELHAILVFLYFAREPHWLNDVKWGRINTYIGAVKTIFAFPNQSFIIVGYFMLCGRHIPSG
jgi:hypothetical protein